MTSCAAGLRLWAALYLSAKSAAILLCAIIHAGTGTAPRARVLPGPFGWTKGVKTSSMPPIISMWFLQCRSNFTRWFIKTRHWSDRER